MYVWLLKAVNKWDSELGDSEVTHADLLLKEFFKRSVSYHSSRIVEFLKQGFEGFVEEVLVVESYWDFNLLFVLDCVLGWLLDFVRIDVEEFWSFRGFALNLQ